MKIAVSALVLALCAFTLPALAATSETAGPSVPALDLLDFANLQSPAEYKIIRPEPYPYCWDLDHDSCYPVGSTKTCTDGIWYDYVCTCRYDSYYRTNYWDCPEVR